MNAAFAAHTDPYRGERDLVEAGLNCSGVNLVLVEGSIGQISVYNLQARRNLVRLFCVVFSMVPASTDLVILALILSGAVFDPDIVFVLHVDPVSSSTGSVGTGSDPVLTGLLPDDTGTGLWVNNQACHRWYEDVFVLSRTENLRDMASLFRRRIYPDSDRNLSLCGPSWAL